MMVLNVVCLNSVRLNAHKSSRISIVKEQKRRISDAIRHKSFRRSKQIIFWPIRIVQTVVFA